MAIEIEHLRKQFGDVTAVDDVSMTLESGEILVLLGGSGSGKTTLLRMVNRLIEPSDGVVRIGGEDTRRMPPHELRRRIGYCFQRVGLFPHLTVAENVGVTPE
ncbi:MAG: ATP-binding cassette domain-containing protein, partial [Candidatus Binatia bacterium]